MDVKKNLANACSQDYTKATLSKSGLTWYMELGLSGGKLNSYLIGDNES